MDNKKIDISSSALEKGLEIAKNFLDKLIMPAIEETGLLLKDQVSLWKFKNQVKMINKAKSFCEKNNISPKTISLKLLCPLFDYSAIEDDEILQDKWAILLSNMVDSEQNIENHVFPYILSQLSTNEFLILEKVFGEKQNRIKQLNYELDEYRKNKPKFEEQIKTKLNDLKNELEQLNNDKMSHGVFNEVWRVQKEQRKQEAELHTLNYKETTILFSLKKPEIIPDFSLEEFELSNLIRLGLVKEVKDFYTGTQRLEIPNEHDDDYLKVDFDIEVESNVENILTELGELFINACQEKTKKQPLTNAIANAGLRVR